MKKILNLLLLLSITIITASCVPSPEEKQQRRDNAFDISGEYVVVTSSYTPTTLKIINEDSFSNVYGTITRGDFTEAEKAAFSRQNISLNAVEKFRTNFKIGLGRHFSWFPGGENISDDIGASSKLFITTSSDEGLFVDQYEIDYSVSGTMHKNDKILKGRITMTIIKNEVVNGQKQYVTKETINMSF
ncbi:MAG: hypothetical protein HOP07_15625 [Bacteriovoracaceae bacterium]|nr:hypothetical protein [Bacteriovoracaceae bacterium]